MSRKVRNVWPYEDTEYCVDERGRLYKPKIGPVGRKYYIRSDGKNFEYKKRKHMMVPTWGVTVWHEGNGTLLDAIALTVHEMDKKHQPKPKRPSNGTGIKVASGIASCAVGFWSGLNGE